MTEPSEQKSDNKGMIIAVISSGATILAALIGLVPMVLNANRGGEKTSTPSALAAKEESPAVKKGPRSERPPLKVSCRSSKVPGQGMVLNLTNAAENETLKGVVVYVAPAGEKDERSHHLSGSIRPNDTLSVGSKELKNNKLNRGDRVRIQVEGYREPVEYVVPRS